MSVTYHELGEQTDLQVLDQFLSVKGLFLVDAGCGAMQLSRSLAERGASVLGIDPDPLQAEKNRQMPVVANVGFAQTGADAVPVESGSVDGVVFSYSLHHIPQEAYASVFTEIARIVRPGGFLYVMEPVAAGELDQVMRLFHDERLVRQAAQTALDTLAAPLFHTTDVVSYAIPVQYNSWEQYADRYAGKSYNQNYTEAQVRAEPVRERFMALGEPLNFRFTSPMKVTYMRNRKSGHA